MSNAALFAKDENTESGRHTDGQRRINRAELESQFRR